jgi:acetyl-CoA carboxylase beta subunit
MKHKKQGAPKPPKTARRRGPQKKRRTGERAKDSREVSKMQILCPHCGAGVHTVKFCGQYRICAVCDTCGHHTRLGGRIAR